MPLEGKSLAPGTVWVITLDLDQPGEPLDAFAQVLSAEERKRAERLIRDRDRRRFIVGRGMLRRTLGVALEKDPGRIAFTYAAQGKPTVEDRMGTGRSLQFNLAHSDRLAMLALTVDDPVGIDIERVRPVKLRDGIVRKHFSPVERETFQRLPEDVRQEAFFRVWTRKEAIVKAIGTGLTLSLTSFDVSLEARPASALVAMRHPDYAGEPWSLRALDAPEGFCAALAVARSEPLDVRYL
ncbi:4'-phosphopantetheinyl transferase family protein [Candidatus Laterigemmans baculatus]|uniref:4'-phosphopantetheinyl transferase family protein n=1 Tax=Candidatus Laterigemmans baculatus TaxID=2770505 RepID=UPI0013DB52D5|nr:4'-phosphopantetheinyl transferase superfamily protein [Candidatus Laterigemmans baculatus]